MPQVKYLPWVIRPLYQQVAGILLSPCHPSPHRVMAGEEWMWYKDHRFGHIFCLVEGNGEVGWGRISFNYEISVMLVVISVT